MSTRLDRAHERWQRLSARERSLATLAAGFILAAAAWGVHDWQQRERTRLQSALPAAQTRLLAMRQMADEFQQWSAQGKAGRQAPASAESVLGTLKAKGLAVEGGPAGAGQLAIKGKVAFDPLVEALAALPAMSWRVDRVTVSPPTDGGSPAGVVLVDALLVAVN